MIPLLRCVAGLVLCIVLSGGSLAALPEAASRAYESRDGRFSVPLTIKDNSGVERHNWPVTTGVPLPYGTVQDVAELRLVDGNGRELPLQAEVLSRHWARDKSIRWVLLDFQISLTAGGKAVVYLQNRRPEHAIADPVRLHEEGDVITIRSGPLTARVSTQDGSLFKSVSIDDHEILRAQPDDGPWLRSGEVGRMEHNTGSAWNTHGWEKTRSVENVDIAEHVYRSGPPNEVVVETRGPLRTVVLVRGRHLPGKSGKGILRDGLYNYTTRLHFFRGHSFVKVEHAVENSDRAQPLYNHMFREAGLAHALRLDGEPLVTGGGLQAESGLPATASTRLAGSEQAWLYQGAAEAEKKHGRVVVREGNYQVGIGRDGQIEKPLAAGKRGRFLDISDSSRGLAVAMRYLWEHAPRAIALSPGSLQVVLQADSPGHAEPRDGLRPEYDLDFGRRNVHDVLYYFHRADARTARVAEVAEAFEYPLFAHAPPAWYSDSETWYFEIARDGADLRRSKMSDGHWVPDGAGLRAHGQNSSYNSGGHHDSLSSGWLAFLSSGLLSELEKNLAYGRWSISQNPGWAYLDNVIRFGEGAQRLTAVDRALADWNLLAGFGPKEFYTWQSERQKEVKTPRGPVIRQAGGWSYLNGYKVLPDMEHFALFRLFEYYYLTGDRRALDAINGFVNWDINFQHVHLFKGRMQPLSNTSLFDEDSGALWRGHYARVYTWMLYTNLAGFHATGSPVFDEFARWQVRRMLAVLRHRHGQLTSIKREEQVMGKMLEFFRDSPMSISSAQTWMEAQGVLALHEAYKTYDDERILDGLWGQADYFSHHVLFYPGLGMINNWATMPSQYIGADDKSVTPSRHDHLLQAFPYLYHYTGWPEMRRRYEGIVNGPGKRWSDARFEQVIAWERTNVAKRSTTPPEPITDLRIVQAGRGGVTLNWTAPRDDGPTGRAARYFVKYSDKPIVEFAPTDHPQRAAEKQRVVAQVESVILARPKKVRLDARIDRSGFTAESLEVPRAHPDWDRVNAFWMAEHTAGAPLPGPAGSAETFTLRELLPHGAFGAPTQPTLDGLKPGTYYVAICSWDADRNLSRVSNVVKFTLK